jgi:hypothetical protein
MTPEQQAAYDAWMYPCKKYNDQGKALYADYRAGKMPASKYRKRAKKLRARLEECRTALPADRKRGPWEKEELTPEQRLGRAAGITCGVGGMFGVTGLIFLVTGAVTDDFGWAMLGAVSTTLGLILLLIGAILYGVRAAKY